MSASEPSLETMRMRMAIAIAVLHKTLLSSPFPDVEALRYDWSVVGERLIELNAFMKVIEKQPAPEPIPQAIEVVL